MYTVTINIEGRWAPLADGQYFQAACKVNWAA